MLLYIIIIIVGVILDQLTKFVAVIWLSGVTTVPIIPNVFHLTYVENTGAAFSLFSDMQLFLIIITVIFTSVLCYILYILPKKKQYFTANFALSLMIGGALGNLIDRVRLAYVVDFFDFKIIGFAIFNVADILVVVGTLLLAYSLLRDKNLLSSKSTSKRKSTRRHKAEAYSEETPKAVSKSEETPASIHKDVLKDLKTETKEKRVDITPDVHTDLIRLPSRKPIEFEPTPSLIMSSPEAEDPPVKIYHPKHSRPEGSDSNTDVISVSEIREQLKSNDEIIIKHKNRYSERMEHYEESVRKQREKTGPIPDEYSRRERYTKNVDHYANSVQQNRENQAKSGKSKPLWNPSEDQNLKKRQSKKQSPIWNLNDTGKVAHKQSSKERYGNVLDNYEASIKSKRKNPSGSPEYPTWEPTVREKKRQSAKKPESTSVDNTHPVHKNRYTDRTDSYIESIKRAKEKKYTSED